MSFVMICLEEINDNIEENLRYNAISSRVAQASEEDFAEFMKLGDDSKSNLVVDHESQMRQFLQG